MQVDVGGWTIRICEGRDDLIHLLTYGCGYWLEPDQLQELVRQLMQLLKNGRKEGVERIRLRNRDRPTKRRSCKHRARTSRGGRGLGAKRRQTRLRSRLPNRGRHQTSRRARGQNRSVNRSSRPSNRTRHCTGGRRGPSNQRTVRGSG